MGTTRGIGVAFSLLWHLTLTPILLTSTLFDFVFIYHFKQMYPAPIPSLAGLFSGTCFPLQGINRRSSAAQSIVSESFVY